ncbi:HAD family hydrolase [Phaeovulum sp. W22_SRMD_FR3]|uniref:HAD family hydrolase n=1 Tax=Phaeovulum sp. W22_SRMD_FR3 TaxID=3240274 RepID=UPI003F9706E6
MEPKLIIFDCDGVLIDSEIISAKMLVAELAPLGVHIDLDYIGAHFLGRSYPVVMQQIRQEFGVTLPVDFEDRYRERLLAAFERGLKVIPHVTAVLETLTATGRNWCVATSSSPKRAELSLRIAGLDHLVAGRLYTSSLVARGKPAPDLFLHAAAARGVAPEACLVIEDSLNGVRAGRAAGMRVWRFIGGSHLADKQLHEPDDALPERRFASFDDFTQRIGATAEGGAGATAETTGATTGGTTAAPCCGKEEL